MKLIIENNKIVATALDTYTSDDYLVITAPEGFDIDRLSDYQIINGEAVLVPIANWDSFNLAMITDADFNQVYNNCLAIAPLIANALPSALTQVAEGKLSMFDLIFNQICQIGNADSTMREVWGGYALSANLPMDFITIINPPE